MFGKNFFLFLSKPLPNKRKKQTQTLNLLFGLPSFVELYDL